MALLLPFELLFPKGQWQLVIFFFPPPKETPQVIPDGGHGEGAAAHNSEGQVQG